MHLSLGSFCFQPTVLATTSYGSSTVSDKECSCYLTNGTNSAYYSQHSFHDFRDLGEYARVPDPIRNTSKKAAVTSIYFKSDTWDGTWSIQDWNNRGRGVSLSGDATVLMVNSPNNVYIEENDDDGAASDIYLTLRTMRLPGFQSAAEFESQLTYHYLSVRMLACITGSPGACMALFTYLGGEELADVQEAGIEIMTRDANNRVQYTKQPSFTEDGDEVAKATHNATLPDGIKWDDWVVHRLDWTPERSLWHAQGQEVASIEFQTPKDPAQLIINTWSGGGSWSGNMSVNDAAYMQIQWIDIVYNTTKENEGKRSLDGQILQKGVCEKSALTRREDGEDECKVVCDIDDVDNAGDIKVLWRSAAAYTTEVRCWTKTLIIGLAIMMLYI
ncbi:hypothetical protein FGRMN_2437 [Fusarium graminum]|nr:hypothetical protein FGRMN_2437 [Fusarium graminum]